MLSCAAGGDDPKRIAAPRKHDSDGATVRLSYRKPALLIVAVGTTEQNRPVESTGRLVEVDAVFAAIARRLVFVPFNRSNAIERFSRLFRHSEAPRSAGCDTSCITEVRYDGLEVLSASSSVLGDMYIQTYLISVKLVI